MHTHTTPRTLSDYRWCFLSVGVAAALMAMPGPAYATNLCGTIVTYINGDLGKAIATLGVIAVAVGATFGRVTWSTAVLVAVGIAGIFGAGTLAGTLASGSGCTGL